MLRKTLLTIAVGVAALAFGASSSKAVEIDFGALALPGGCNATSDAQAGHVCGNTVTYTGTPAGTLTGQSFNGAPTGIPAGNVTVRLLTDVGGALNESGLGQTPNATCLADCEINGTASVAITSSVALGLADVLVGSAQAGEQFSVWTLVGGVLQDTFPNFVPNATNCPNSICTFNFAGTTEVAVQNTGTGNVLLTSVSTPAAAPEPASLAVLGAALVGFGMMRRRRR